METWLDVVVGGVLVLFVLLLVWEWRLASCWVDFLCRSMMLVILWMISGNAVSFCVTKLLNINRPWWLDGLRQQMLKAPPLNPRTYIYRYYNIDPTEGS